MKILGLDGGIASIGWAVLDLDISARHGQILAAGTRMFHAPEETTTSGPKLKNAERRTHRLARRTTRRRKQRMRDIRQLFMQHGLLENTNKTALAQKKLDPWQLRLEGLDRQLSPIEFAVALYHIAKHRGFKSNKKGERANKADDDSKMLTAIDATQEKLARYRTVGEMFAKDPAFAQRKRNRDGDYTRSILRDDLESEVRKLFAAQRKFGKLSASQALEEEFKKITFFQRPLASSFELIGMCQFIDSEKRACAFAPSFERFRMLSKLVNLRILSGRSARSLLPNEIETCASLFASTKSISYKKLRSTLGLEEREKFEGVSPDKEAKDFVRSKGAAAGTKTLLDILRPIVEEFALDKLLSNGEVLDDAMTVIAFNEDLEQIEVGLAELTLPEVARQALLDAARNNYFDFVNGTGHISNVAARLLSPHLKSGLRYDQACEAVGWDHAAQRAYKLDDITSPVAQKSAREIMKQVKVLETEYGPFDQVIVEMARDVGKSIEERGKIESGLKKRTAARQRSEAELMGLLKVSHVSNSEVLAYELWKEQQGRCLYTGKVIPVTAIRAKDNSVQVDHILPWSRFGDNSFHNKTLCYTSANHKKLNKTPFEWKSAAAPEDWERFQAEVEACKEIKGLKKRNYLLRHAEEREDKFRSRNLNDTRYALKVVLGLLRSSYPDIDEGVRDDGSLVRRRRVFARPGAVTAALRRAWGVESLKKSPDGKRLPDDRHHALDAIITACCSEGMLQRATQQAQRQEKRGEKFELRGLETPWGDHKSFRRDVRKAFLNVFVSRPEAGRLRGKAHDATIKQIRIVDGVERLFERRAVHDLTMADLERIPVPKPYGKIHDPAKLRNELVDNLKTWIERRDSLTEKLKSGDGKTEKDAVKAELAELPPPLSPRGDPIKKVRLLARNKKAVAVRGGSADRAGMVRVDVFSKCTARGKRQYHLVPIYRNDVYNSDNELKTAPPNRAVVANKDESEWTVVDSTFEFQFSIVSSSLIEITTPKGEVVLGYFRGLDRSNAKIGISPHHDMKSKVPGCGSKTLLNFSKMHVDRLGRVCRVRRETRTWRGQPC